jgi:GT2 family glycosyltransferase
MNQVHLPMLLTHDPHRRTARAGTPTERTLDAAEPYDLRMTTMTAAGTLPTVAVVVVTYNNLADTRECLASVRTISYSNVRIIVVDNGSTPREDEVLRAELGETAEVLRVAVNRGYGPGANVGIDRALMLGADFVWLLNNDALVDAASLGALMDAAVQDDRVGILSPVIAAPPGPEAPHGVWYAGGSIDLALAQTRHVHEPPAGVAPFKTEYVTGCAMLVRSSVFREVGLLREDLFLYWEDVDLNLRAIRGGWSLVVVPRATVFHKVHGSIPPRVIRRYPGRNAIWIVALHADMGTFLRAMFHRGTGITRSWISAILRRHAAPWPETLGYLQGIFGAVAARSRAIPRPARP